MNWLQSVTKLANDEDRLVRMKAYPTWTWNIHFSETLLDVDAVGLCLIFTTRCTTVVCCTVLY